MRLLAAGTAFLLIAGLLGLLQEGGDFRSWLLESLKALLFMSVCCVIVFLLLFALSP